ncbi:MAG: hypothetical protein JW759_07250 [Candidatus Coatesbacteria bacterium]|nr:hypothetical protein [Candidatus Coatesbacteria bacterium]
MKKRDIALTVVCLFAFMYTSVWVQQYLRSRDELLRGEALTSTIAKKYLAYAKLLPLREKNMLTAEQDQAFEETQYDYYQAVTQAITAFDNCLHCYTPFNEYLPRAAKAMMDIGDDCLNKNEFHLSLRAYRLLRVSPDPEWVMKADKMIEEAYAKIDRLRARTG